MDKVLGQAYNPSYLAIDDILALETMVPCTTECKIPKFGFLAPQFGSGDLPSGVSLPLPAWLAQSLWRPNQENKIITADVPSQFKETLDVITDPDTDPVLTDLKGTHFHDSALICATAFLERNSDMDEFHASLLEGLKDRLLCVGDTVLPRPKVEQNRYQLADKNVPMCGPMVTGTLDSLEKKIFDDHASSMAYLDRWMSPLKHKIEARVLETTQIKQELEDMETLDQVQEDVEADNQETQTVVQGKENGEADNLEQETQIVEQGEENVEADDLEQETQFVEQREGDAKLDVYNF